MNEWKELQRNAEQQGWKVTRTRKGHLKWLSPDGKTMTVSGSTPSDNRAIKNQAARMRRGGYRD